MKMQKNSKSKQQKEVKENLKKITNDIICYVGLPGSGKSTIAAAYVQDCLKRNIKVYSNVPIVGANEYKVNDLGKYMIEHAILIVDEAGLEYNGRAYKSFSTETMKFAKLYRHYKIYQIILFSQANDVDKVWRDLASKYYIVKRIGHYITSAVPVTIDLDSSIDKSGIVKTYTVPHGIKTLFSRNYYWMPKYWKLFDSWDAPVLPPMPHNRKYEAKVFSPKEEKILGKVVNGQYAEPEASLVRATVDNIDNAV